MGQCIGEASKERTVQTCRGEIINNISISGENLQLYIGPDLFRKIIGQGFIAVKLFEYVTLRNKTKDQGWSPPFSLCISFCLCLTTAE